MYFRSVCRHGCRRYGRLGSLRYFAGTKCKRHLRHAVVLELRFGFEAQSLERIFRFILDDLRLLTRNLTLTLAPDHVLTVDLSLQRDRPGHNGYTFLLVD